MRRMKCQFISLVLVSLFNFTRAVDYLNITGGKYELKTYKNSYVIRAQSDTGPKMCIKECMLQENCNAINFKMEDYTCELLAWLDTDTTDTNTNSMFSHLSDWTMDHNQCWPNPCASNERCIIAMHGHHVCVPVDDACAINRCLNGGTCRNAVEGFRCVCPTGYSGDTCHITPCTNNPCVYGTCTIEGSSYMCNCPSPWFNGTQCQNTPCTNNYCSNEATCVMSGASYSCNCTAEYTGTRCKTLVNP